MGDMRGLRRRTIEAQPENSNPPADPPVEVPGLERIRSFKGLPNLPFHIGWSSDGAYMVATGGQGSVVVWSTTSRRSRRLTGHGSESVMGMALHPSHPSHSRLATGALDRTVRLWDIAAETSLLFYTSEQEISAVSWSPSGGRLAIGERAGEVSIWDVEKQMLLQRARVHEGDAKGLCWSRDEKFLVSCSSDGTINLLSTDDLKVIRNIRGHSGSVASVAISPDGRHLASGSEDTTVRIWALQSGAEIATLEGHTGWVLDVKFSVNSEFLASASAAPESVLLWRCRDWERVAALPQFTDNGIGGLAFHPSQPLFAAKNQRSHRIDCYRIDYDLLGGLAAGPGSRRYGNAKVVLLGDTGVGNPDSG
jgi:WD40 repeat protein